MTCTGKTLKELYINFGNITIKELIKKLEENKKNNK